MVYFVTGATGFFGRHVVAALRATDPGALIRCLVRRQGVALAAANIEAVVGDLHDEAALQRGLTGCEAVLHLAGATYAKDPSVYTRVNEEGTAKVVAAAERAGVGRFVFASSRAASGKSCGAYGASKQRAEEMIRQSRLPYVILRFAEIYGPDAPGGIATLVRMVRWTPLVPILRGGELAPVAIADAVSVVLASLMAKGVEGKTYTIAGPRSYSVEECVQTIAEVLRVRRLCVPIPAGLLRIGLTAGRWIGLNGVVGEQVERLLCKKETDIERAVQDLGFRPLSFSEYLPRLYQQTC